MADQDARQGYGWSPGVQRKLVALCLRDAEAWGQLGPRVFDAQWITYTPLREIARLLYRACQDHGGRPPSAELFAESVEERARQLKPNVAEAVRKEWGLLLTADLSDARHVRAKAVEWSRTEACAQAALQAAEIIERGAVHDGERGGSEIVRLFQDALAIGQGNESRVRLIRGYHDVMQELTVDERKVPTGFAPIDEALEGGVEPGLHMMAGVPKLGKTAFLTQLAPAACRLGLTVWYISGEIKMRPMIRRQLRAMTGVTKEDIRRSPAQAVRRMMRMYGPTGGEIILDYAPAFTASWIASELRQLEGQGDRIGLIITDFIDIMGSQREQAERRFELEETGRRLRDLGVEAGIPIWTAKALNRKAVSKPIPTKADLAECFGLGYIVDNLFVLCGTEEEQRGVPIMRDGQSVIAPVIRIVYDSGREDADQRLLGAWDRNNDLMHWTHLPGYFQQQGAATAEVPHGD